MNPKPLQLKSLFPKPQRLQERRPMTIAAGFLCDEGIIIAADREVQADADKYEESKIFTLHPDSVDMNPAAVFAGSGWLDFVKMAVDKISRESAGVSHTYEIETIIEKTILEIHRKHIRYYPTSPKPYFTLIIGLRDESGLILLETAGTSIVRVRRQVCIGAGKTLGSYLSRVLSPTDLSLEATATVATQIIDQVKKNVPECGGMFSEVVILPKHGLVRRLTPSRMLQIEYASRDVSEAIRPLLLSLSDPTLTDSEFEVEMERFNIECRKRRDEQKQREGRIMAARQSKIQTPSGQ